jgi:hypothetical protein
MEIVGWAETHNEAADFVAQGGETLNREPGLGFSIRHPYPERMRFAATLMIVLAWLAYGTMSALAGCAMCASEIAAVDTDAAAHQHMPGMDIGARTKPSPAKDPCSTGGTVHMPFCSACVVASATVVGTADGRTFASDHPLPALDRDFPGTSPQPPAPPPRLA